MRVFSDVGLMREGFFVDYVDTEWGLRAKTIGLDICGVFSVLKRNGTSQYYLR